MSSRKKSRPAPRGLPVFSWLKARGVTAESRAALAGLMRTDPERFIAACVAADVKTLRDIPAWMELLVTDRWRAAEIAVLAEEAGIGHKPPGHAL